MIRAIQRAKAIREKARKRRLKVFNDEREKVKKYWLKKGVPREHFPAKREGDERFDELAGEKEGE